MNKTTNKKFMFVLATILWIAFAIVSGLIFYANHYFPHGPMYDTGDVVCQNDDQGPCSEKYVEDTRNLHIPEWAKFFKSSDGLGLWEVLLVAVVIATVVAKGEDKPQN